MKRILFEKKEDRAEGVFERMNHMMTFAILSTLAFGLASNAKCMLSNEQEAEDQRGEFPLKKRIQILYKKSMAHERPKLHLKAHIIYQYNELVLQFVRGREIYSPADVKDITQNLILLKNCIEAWNRSSSLKRIS